MRQSNLFMDHVVRPRASVLPASSLARIHTLWDELTDFGAEQTDAALEHVLRTLSDLVEAQRSFWLGAVRLQHGDDPLSGWRIRGIRRTNSTPEDERVYKLSWQRLEEGVADDATRAQVRGAGRFRVALLRHLVTPKFFRSKDYDVLYRARDVYDALFATVPVNEDAESYLGWYRAGAKAGRFRARDRDLVAYALRPLKWFYRRVMLHHGFLIAKAPLTNTDRRVLALLLTERAEKEIAHDLGLTLATTHGYVTGLFRKFGVSGRSGLTALWLGKLK